MRYTQRFENAIAKLYSAFTCGKLNPECCIQCAAGNIVDNKDYWKHFSDTHGSLKLNYVGNVHEFLGRRINGYLPSEILKTEYIFLQACGYGLPFSARSIKPKLPHSQDTLFNGLCAVITYLGALDGIENVMEVTGVFEKVLENRKLMMVV